MGTELHVAEMVDFAAELVTAGNYVSITSLDIDGAFDTVSHRVLIETLKEHRVDKYVIRSISGWLLNRSFRVRLRTSGGVFFSRGHPKTVFV